MLCIIHCVQCTLYILTLIGRWAGRGYAGSSERNTGTIAKQHSEKTSVRGSLERGYEIVRVTIIAKQHSEIKKSVIISEGAQKTC